ncbi:MAG: alginate export family protein [Bacteroidales bacterium]|jgi:hypothetical protein|nr:alginate export family protein [Bacteroidales bacterium]
MRNKLYSLALLFILILMAGSILAQQINVSAEIRPRYEFRHGYKILFPDDAKAANFISQRTRLNGFFSNQTFKAYVSLQDVRVWGDVNQLNTSDVNGFSVHEAWGQVRFCDVFSLKVGRQEIAYDDQRMFGSVGWAQQARSHDAAILKFTFNENHNLDLGLALNAMKESLYEVKYANSNYKALQYVWYHGNFGKHGLSILFLNNGIAYDGNVSDSIYDEKVSYSQTIGARYTLKTDKVGFDVAAYSQMGKNGKHNDLSAFYFTANINFQATKAFNIGLGGEYLSGTSTKNQGLASEKDQSFTPFYGTNHKFNGWMDYFYVGNYIGKNGLIDMYLPLKLKVQKVTFALIPHYFLAAATVSAYDESSQGFKDYSNGLGAEIDFSITYALSKSVAIAGGYSQMFGTETMQAVNYPENLPGEFNKNTNNWAWIMLTFKPTFFSKDESQ